MNDRSNNIYKEIMLKLYHLAQMDGENSIRLPPLRKLAEQFGCTHPTVLRAVRELVKRDVLIQLKNGDYRTIPQFTRKTTRYLALIYRMGMDLLDTAYSADIKYNAVKYLTHLPEDLSYSEIRTSSCDDIENSIRSGIYQGAILCVPPKNIIPAVTDACRDSGIPLGIFGGTSADDGDVAVFYDAEKDFLELFKQLVQRDRRRILVLSPPLHRENDDIREALEKFSGSFEKAVFKVESVTECSNYVIQNVGGAGEDFDCVVYPVNTFETYQKIMEKTADCLCVMTNFGVWKEKSFHGLMMNYDLEAAGVQFGRAMSALLNKQIPENPRGGIPCTIQEIP